MIRFTHIITATVVALVPVAASAQSSGSNVQEVYYADLDLTSAAGQATLETRINTAVRKACEVRNDARSLSESMDERQCINKARGTAIVIAKKQSSTTLAAK